MPEAWRTTTQAVDHTMLPTVLQATAAAIAFNAKQVDSTPRVPLQPKKLKVLDAASDSSGMVSQQATKVSTKNDLHQDVFCCRQKGLDTTMA